MCEVTEPGVKVTWLKNNLPLSLTQGRFHTISKDYSHKLIIPNVTIEDIGEYTVKAGELESTAVLIVNGQYQKKIDKAILNFINS